MVDALQKHGMEVTWITGQFHHQLKVMRDVPSGVPMRPGGLDGPELVFLPSRGYSRHLSFRRFRDHADTHRAFQKVAPDLPRPDVIICAWPTIDLAFAATEFGGAYGIPVVLDIRDLWPDIFYERITARTGLPIKGYFLPWERMGKKAIQNADAVISITHGMLDWAQKRFGRNVIERDAVFHQCQYSSSTQEDLSFWKNLGVDLDAPKTRLVWSGTLVSDLDIQTLLTAIESLPDKAASELEFVFCGSGDLSTQISEMADRLPHVVYAGWVSQSALQALYARSHIGLMAYLDRFDFQLSIPNKVIDFLRSEMRILTNLSGEMERVLAPERLLINYPTGDAVALAAQLVKIAANADRYRSPAPLARTLFDRMFNADTVMPRFAKYVEQLAKDGRK